MFVLSLIAAFAGTPLRLAEAAHDMVCSVADLGGDDSLEMPDGGVGDDSGATIKADTTDASLKSAFSRYVPAAHFITAARSLHSREGQADLPERLASGVPRRLAQLQSFLC